MERTQVGYTVIDHLQVIKLSAPNDANGNPRRLYVLLAGSAIVRVYDEGYSGTGAAPVELRPLARMADMQPIEIASGEYRRLRKLYE